RAEYPDRRMYMAWVKEQPMAFGEIIPQDNGRPRLGRILVGNPAIRGMGIGARFITALVDECGRLYDCDAVELNVWDENISAIRCYEKVGFVFQADDRTVLSAFGRTFNIHKMVKMR
ncbi:MAG: GNAT family N-acetyltransferase, partial [Parapedobacter sp.]